MKQKLKYFLRSTIKNLKRTGYTCPSCQNETFDIVERKYFVTTLNRCKKCYLLYRAPTTTEEENNQFYQKEYDQGFTTDYPNDDDLSRLLQNRFIGSEKNYTEYIDLIKIATGYKNGRIFDFGCSWGYGSWQFSQHGYDVESYEISKPRAEYARKKLGLKVHESLQDVTGTFDIFFSSHVLEHVPSVSKVIEFGFSILRPGGLFLAITPNGSDEHRKTNYSSWSKLWGAVHPNFLDSKYYNHYFREKNLFISSNPFDLKAIHDWGSTGSCGSRQLKLNGSDLLILVKKNT